MAEQRALGSKEKTTAAACIRSSCEGCSIRGKLLCVHTKEDLVGFGVLFIGWLVPFLAGMIRGKHWIGLGVWVGLAAVFFGYLEALVLCRHCPQYAEEGSTLKCHANWGLPKIPRLDPRPLSGAEKAIWLAYGVVLFLYHVPFFIVSRQWLLLALTTWSALSAVWSVQRNQCVRCYNLSCPGNRVREDVRRVFFANYPAYAKSWGRQSGTAAEMEDEES